MHSARGLLIMSYYMIDSLIPDVIIANIELQDKISTAERDNCCMVSYLTDNERLFGLHIILLSLCVFFVV